MTPTRVLGLPQSVEIDQRPDKRFRQGLMGPLPQQREAGTNSPPCLLAEGVELVPYTRQVGVCPGFGPERRLGGLPTPEVVLNAAATPSRPCFFAFLAAGCSAVAMGFLVFL
ncbi:unnamed protein product [Rangifer tarandus platyrhynchus]|uniref:Uncharacterized protein n=2 Tax=Rangifer tarandus platyrhynchus TaxID=3082113 RepID=A0AC59ZWB2_RANTA|nr:unnamed protein product [Rangifer tarandus platyrhynchus]